MSRKVGDKRILAIDLVSLAIGAYGLVKVFAQVLPPHLEVAGHWQFLTNLLLAYSMVVFGVGALAHVTRSESLYSVKNFLHPVALALETIVTAVYWPLRLFFLHLLVKDPSKFSLPLPADLLVHLMPVTSLLVDYLLFMPRWTIGVPFAFSFCAVLTIGYWFWLKLLIDFASGGQYPYVFLNVDSEQARVVIFGIVGMTAFVQFLVMRQVYDWIVAVPDLQAEVIEAENKKTE